MSYDNLSSVSQNVLKFISSLLVKRGGSLSFLTIFTLAVPELLSLPNNVWRLIVFAPFLIIILIILVILLSFRAP